MHLEQLHSPEIFFALVRLQIIVMEPYVIMPPRIGVLQQEGHYKIASAGFVEVQHNQGE